MICASYCRLVTEIVRKRGLMTFFSPWCIVTVTVCEGQNRLNELPESFGNLSSLRCCQLSNNNIELLPSSFGNLSNLEELRLDNNIVRYLCAIWTCVVCCRSNLLTILNLLLCRFYVPVTISTVLFSESWKLYVLLSYCLLGITKLV